MAALDDAMKANLIETAKALRGAQRRLFMARTVCALGRWRAAPG